MDQANKRAWAIRRWCLLTSLTLALIAEALLVAATVVASKAARSQDLLLLALGWPLFYAVLYGIARGIAIVDQRGPVMSQFPQWFRVWFFPFQRVMNAWYRIVPNIALLVFRLFMIFFSILLLWGAATGTLNP